MTKTNLFTWLLLIALTVASYLFSEGNLTGTYLVFYLMGITIIKFTSIGWHFIELKYAHGAWKVLYIGFIFFFSILVVAYI